MELSRGFLKKCRNLTSLIFAQIKLCIDSTSIKVHPDAAGALKSSGEQSIGRSKGG